VLSIYEGGVKLGLKKVERQGFPMSTLKVGRGEGGKRRRLGGRRQGWK